MKQALKIVGVFCLLILSAFVIVAVIKATEDSPKASIEPSKPEPVLQEVKSKEQVAREQAEEKKKQEIKDRFDSDREPTTLTSDWDSNRFFVAVFDNGSKRDGYAQYVCTVLKDEYGLAKTFVKVISAVGESRFLGKAYCK